MRRRWKRPACRSSMTCYEGTIHGFMNMGRVLRGAHGRARKRLASWLAARLHDL